MGDLIPLHQLGVSNMTFRHSLIFVLAVASSSGAAFAQGCTVTVAGQSMAEMIGRAGGAEKLYQMSQAQIAEYDRWFTEMETARGQGIREAEIDALIEQGRANQEIERQISAAARCYMGG
jgi:hypothetical protein